MEKHVCCGLNLNCPSSLMLSVPIPQSSVLLEVGGAFKMWASWQKQAPDAGHGRSYLPLALV